MAEDAAFFEHEGMDLEEIRKSIEINMEQGRAIRGASTITQQLAKNLYLSPSRNPLRKLRELIIARRLEAALPKARIFEIYLNVIEWGDGIWGAEAAARQYFGVSGVEAEPRAGGAAGGRDHQSAGVESGAPDRAAASRGSGSSSARMGEVTPPAPVRRAPARRDASQATHVPAEERPPNRMSVRPTLRLSRSCRRVQPTPMPESSAVSNTVSSRLRAPP